MSEEMYNPMGQVFKYLSISIFFMFVGYMVGLFLPDSFIGMANLMFTILIVGLLIMAIISKKSIIPRRFSMNFVYLFTFIDGILISPIVRYYVGSLGSGVVINVLVATLVICGVLGFIASRSESDKFLSLGPVLFAAMIGLLIMGILNIFIYGRLFNITVSIIGVVLFSAYILYDVSVLKADIEYGNIRDKDDLSIHVLNLYIDFVNIFLDLLRLVREFND